MNNNTRKNCIFSTHNLRLLLPHPLCGKGGQSMEIAFQTEISITWCGETLVSNVGNLTAIIAFQLTASLGQRLGAQLSAVRACGFPFADNAASLVSVHRIVQHRRDDRRPHESSCNWNSLLLQSCLFIMLFTGQVQSLGKGPSRIPFRVDGNSHLKVGQTDKRRAVKSQISLNS